ncbi:MarC family protein [Breoghania sp.]|uniref:MarC family protein n=1 Tax=Breoghania sp. TaxID=2065378 RepID=UPI002AAB0718|nr:MarC family protein [Breoghania sp.]
MSPELSLANALHQFATLFAVIDPVGTVPVFIAVTASVAHDRRRSVAFRAVLFAALVLMGFLIAGQPVLNAISVNLTSFQIAGGIVLFLFALTMIFGDSKPEKEISEVSRNVAEWAVYPLAIPSIASPGAMLAVVVLTDNNIHSIPAQAMTAGITLMVLGLSLLLMLAAMPVQRMIGKAGASIVSRVMGLILAAVAVDHVINAIIIRFGL